MKKYIAFLRGINISGNNKIRMSDLKLELENAGFTQVTTYLNSGNVTFLSDDNNLKNRIEDMIINRFATTSLKTAARGVVLNLLNPKLTIFFFSFLPQFIPSDTVDKIDCMVVLSLVFMLMTLIVFIIYGLIAGALRELVQRRKPIMKNIERGFALSFAGLSIKLALEER